MTVCHATFHDLAGQSVFITGGGSGIGAATCRLFAREGAAVTVLDRDAAAAAAGSLAMSAAVSAASSP